MLSLSTLIMDDLSLYLLDLTQNSINAQAKMIRLTIEFADKLLITLEDDGHGLSLEQLKVVDSPFYTTRKTRKVGLGLSLVKMLTEQTNGTFKIDSKENLGTTLYLSFEINHIDLPPLGNLGEMVYFVSINQSVVDFIFEFKNKDKTFIYHLKDVIEVFNNDLNNYQTMELLTNYINNQIEEIRG